MIEGFPLFLALCFMPVPFLNILLGIICFGWPGFFAGMLLTMMSID